MRSITVASKSHWIGEIKHFDMFVLRPEAPEKNLQYSSSEHQVLLLWREENNDVIHIHECSFLDLGVQSPKKTSFFGQFQKGV